MKPLLIEAQESTPKVYLDRENSKFEISGKSFPEESRKFYAPVFTWLEEYAKDPNEETWFAFKMEYFNSSSSLILLEIMNILDKIKKSGKEVKVIWGYLDDDDDMLEAGEEYAELVNVPFEYEALEDID
ncbi:MAG TPA: DUF1987 domain-containing protein [Bacteroidales bacterium]|nr:DUF1987 domain-containing protein [Bacteroidales bacterium]